MAHEESLVDCQQGKPHRGRGIGGSLSVGRVNTIAIGDRLKHTPEDPAPRCGRGASG